MSEASAEKMLDLIMTAIESRAEYFRRRNAAHEDGAVSWDYGGREWDAMNGDMKSAADAIDGYIDGRISNKGA